MGRILRDNALAVDLAVKFQITEQQGHALIAKARASKIDPYTLLHGNELPKFPKNKKVVSAKPLNLEKAAGVFDDPVPEAPIDEGVWAESAPAEQTPVATPPPIIPPKPKGGKPQAKTTPAKDEKAEFVRVGDRLIDTTLTLKQKIAILADAIKSGTLETIDLVRAMQLHTELSGDSADGQTYELRVILDDTVPNNREQAVST
jgi:hypothetical protein